MANRFINGPINCIRLESDVLGIKKVIYVFMDVHLSLEKQTKCDTIDNKDIRQYLADNLSKIPQTGKTIDLFLEILQPMTLEDLNDSTYKNYKGIYLEEARDLFLRSFNIDFKKNIVAKSKVFPKARFHYLDVRDRVIRTEDFSFINEILDLMRTIYHFFPETNKNTLTIKVKYY